MQPSQPEMAFGLQPTCKDDKDPVILRNWITFSMRNFIMLEERKAYYRNGSSPQAVEKFFARFNAFAREELITKKLQFDHRDLPQRFEDIVTTNGAIVQKSVQQFVYYDIMQSLELLRMYKSYFSWYFQIYS